MEPSGDGFRRRADRDPGSLSTRARTRGRDARAFYTGGRDRDDLSFVGDCFYYYANGCDPNSLVHVLAVGGPFGDHDKSVGHRFYRCDSRWPTDLSWSPKGPPTART